MCEVTVLDWTCRVEVSDEDMTEIPDLAAYLDKKMDEALKQQSQYERLDAMPVKWVRESSTVLDRSVWFTAHTKVRVVGASDNVPPSS